MFKNFSAAVVALLLSAGIDPGGVFFSVSFGADDASECFVFLFLSERGVMWIEQYCLRPVYRYIRECNLAVFVEVLVHSGVDGAAQQQH